MNRKFTNIKVGVELNSLLSQESLFQGDNYKVIGKCEYFLNTIAWYSHQNADGWAGISCKKLENCFKSTNIKYLDVLLVLEKVGLIQKPRKGFYNRTTRTGMVTRFKLTDLGYRLILDGNREYLRKLHNDPYVDRRNRKNKSQNRAHSKISNDIVLEQIKNNIYELKFNYNAFEEFWQKQSNTLTVDQKFNILYSIINICEGRFKNLTRCHADGRIHHPWVLMSSSIRHLFTLRDKQYARVIDIRACHPTFWEKYLMDTSSFNCFTIFLKLTNNNKYIKDRNKEIFDIINNTLNELNKYNVFKYNYKYKEVQHYLAENLENLDGERIHWSRIWSNLDEDPRSIIATDLGKNHTKDTVKPLLCSAINGSENKVFEWIKRNYPVLFKIWSITDMKKTGNNISKCYETRLILEPALFDLAASLGVEILTEHDGLAVFATEGDPDVDRKAQVLATRIQDMALKLFGVTAVLKVKTVGVTNSGSAIESAIPSAAILESSEMHKSTPKKSE